jgi:hypothetical protein
MQPQSLNDPSNHNDLNHPQSPTIRRSEYELYFGV